jgi:transcriptional regulator with XRE-family HTH domain
MTIGQRLKDRRLELRLSVASVAHTVGMAPSTLYDVERGDQTSSTKLHLLCDLLGLNAHWVETGRGPRLAAQDARKSHDSTPRQTLHGVPITAEEVELGVEWGKLEEPVRSAIRQQVMLLVAEQVRRKRRKQAIADHDGPRSGKS